ncbi:hypothetical protein PNQ29_11705 [Halobacterium salinarum]|nr:hypothetical protein [Halobacterium salinarum]
MMEYSAEGHDYDCQAPSDEITRLLVELDKPYESKRVLRYFHEKLKYSTRQIADLFGVARQTLQDIVRPMDGFSFHQQNGRMTAMDLEQRELDDYEDYEDTGLSDFL